MDEEDDDEDDDNDYDKDKLWWVSDNLANITAILGGDVDDVLVMFVTLG